MKGAFAIAAALALTCLGSIARASITIDTVSVGDPGNSGELSGSGGSVPDRICGSVGYAYNIGKYEVTAGQYTAFLNAVAATDTYGLYNTTMSNTSYGSGMARRGQGSCSRARSGNHIYRGDNREKGGLHYAVGSIEKQSVAEGLPGGTCWRICCSCG